MHQKWEKKWDVVIIDVNNDNVESDLWCPTQDFLFTLIIERKKNKFF